MYVCSENSKNDLLKRYTLSNVKRPEDAQPAPERGCSTGFGGGATNKQIASVLTLASLAGFRKLVSVAVLPLCFFATYAPGNRVNHDNFSSKLFGVSNGHPRSASIGSVINSQQHRGMFYQIAVSDQHTICGIFLIHTDCLISLPQNRAIGCVLTHSMMFFLLCISVDRFFSAPNKIEQR